MTLKVVTIDSSGRNQEKDLDAIAWTDLTLAIGWSNVGSGYATAQYRLTPGGRVVVKGWVSRSLSLLTNGVIATFPAGFRPLQQRVYSLPTQTNAFGYQRTELKANGELIYAGANTLSTGVTLSLDGIEFDAEQ